MNIYIEELHTNLSPHEIYYIFKDKTHTSFLDSGRDEKSLGRYSFIGLNKFLSFIWKKEGCYINDELQIEKDGFKLLKEILCKYKVGNTSKLPFIGGGIGYFSYDLCSKVEKLILNSKDDVDIPLAYFDFYDNIIIFDNLEKKQYISALQRDEDYKEKVKEIKNSILNFEKKEINEILNYNIDINKETIDYNEFNSNFTKDEYINTVEKVRDYIRSGDIYITNLTQRYKRTNNNRKDYEIYYRLRAINPAPFAAFLKYDDFTIISSSPERFLEIRQGQVETRPIKGTKPRGSSETENNKNKIALQNSEKDKSELLMIVDLERNDLSKVCKANSVKVKELFSIEEYSTVYHLVSSIVGEIKDEFTSIDCIKACFPGGSITGAPKIRSIEIIDELECVSRNIYTGAIGYLGFDQNVDLSIVIRTIVMKDDTAYFGVGGGITWESDSKDEYEETLQKAKALMIALN